MPDSPKPDPSERVELGRVVGAHALRGELRVHFFGDDPENLASAPELWLAASRGDPEAQRFEVVGVGSGRPGELRIALAGVSDRSAADALRGRLVLGDARNLAPLDEGEFYWHQLVGCEVRGRDGQPIGEVLEIWETGAHDVLVVRAADGKQHLLSTARELMPEVDLAARVITVELLPGMLDDGREPGPDGPGAPRRR